MHHQAALALKALRIKQTCGGFAAKHNVLGLFRLAQQLEAAK